MQLDALQSLALSVAAARSPDSVLREMVQGLGMWEGVALARVWLLREDGEREPFLELKASIGASLVDPSRRWNRTDGAHHKIPVSFGKVGLVAATNRPLLLHRGPANWVLQPDWATAERIESFAAQPLCFNGQVLGVVAFFSRVRLEKKDLDWLRVFADHAAVAIANARAFEEIAKLKDSAERERDYLREAVRTALQHGEIIAESSIMKSVLAQVRAVAQSDSSVLILGESGVGKELIAAAVHDLSRRKDGPFVKVNCASVPRELFESEFFGHVRGAFSGASRDRQGRFLLADGGSLLLDEVGEIPLEQQGKLLRVLQEQTFEPVGDDRTRHVDVRVIAATNRSLEDELESGRFRRDLYYRLSVVPIVVPPLRERRADVLPMARHFLAEIARRLHVPVRALSRVDEQLLETYDFPGNVRELQNILERAMVLATVRSSGADHGDRTGLGLELEIGRNSSPPPRASHSRAPDGAGSRLPGPADDGEVLEESMLRELERSNLLRALQRCDWTIAGPRGAAKLLGLSASTLAYRMKQLGIERPRHRS